MQELYKEIDDSKEFIVDLQANMNSMKILIFLKRGNSHNIPLWLSEFRFRLISRQSVKMRLRTNREYTLTVL